MAKTRPEHHAEPVLESAMDYAEHEKTYNGFVTGVKWVIYASVVSMIILYFLINP
ncbi:aa3-type cytochrome c oxidase subunit IV [Devosia honganensis]|uniref:Aa3-type cytochrome c oxidase subunit IV n=1 Tax=Devosia honganensis TaxID=1610527 RepID=A0ABV7WX19_9HYPH